MQGFCMCGPSVVKKRGFRGVEIWTHLHPDLKSEMHSLFNHLFGSFLNHFCLFWF
jgi:hypothetical protein